MLRKDHAVRRRVVKELPWLVLLLCLVGTIWCVASGRWHAAAWSVPITYGSDAWWGMAVAKATATGEILPFLPKYAESLGAPFTANWNDYPSSDEGTLAWMGLVALIFGVFVGANVLVLAAHLLAGAAFYFVCRYLRYDRLISLSCAILYAASRYSFSRSLTHLGLTYYWHIPLGILVVWWCVGRARITRDRRKLLVCVGVAVLHAIQNPYYAAMFMQFLAGACLYHVARGEDRRRALVPLMLIGVTVGTLLLANVDTFYSRIVDGPTQQVVQRNYHGLEFYALKPVELLLPVVHRIDWLHTWARESYFRKTMLIGEAGSPYLGFVGIAALGLMVWLALKAVARRRSSEVPSHFWLCLWILAYSVVGGVNGIVGFALELFRSTNRYSIFILTLLLLFLVRQLTAWLRNSAPLARGAIAGVILLVGLSDQIPPTGGGVAAAAGQPVFTDRDLVRTIESKLSAGAMIFQMPVAEFPEVGPIGQMGDYEHFRPYLHSRKLRFSYGNTKGRTRDAWQREAVALGVPYLVEALEKYGFSAVWINRNAYADRGAAIVAGFTEAGRTDLLAETVDFVCIALSPSERPELPLDFASGWHSLESLAGMDWRWSSGDAEVLLHSAGPAGRRVHVTFEIETIQPRTVEIWADDQRISRLSLDAENRRVAVDLPVVFSSSKITLRFETDLPGDAPPNGDPRKLAFRVLNFRVLD